MVAKIVMNHLTDGLNQGRNFPKGNKKQKEIFGK